MDTPSTDDIDALIRQLQAITTAANVAGITQAEREFFAQTSKFKGFMAVSDAFRSLIADTIANNNGPWRPHVASASPLRQWLLPRLAQNFHWLCGAEQQAFAGYPFPAFAQVRNIFDSAVVSSAVVQGIVSLHDAEGITPGVPIDVRAMKRKRIDAERTIDDKMTGAGSGLSPTTLGQLEIINRLFDWETHGHRLSATQSMEWLARTGPLRVLPHYDDKAFAPFMNRYLETMWMVHRLWPLIRPPSAPLSDDWRDKWIVIDGFLQTCAFSLTAQFGKPVGEAVVDFVKTKFPFNATSTLTT
jgi:hypothetical protein